MTLRDAAGLVTGLTGTLHSRSPDVEVRQADASFGDLGTGDTASNTASRFVLHAAPNAPIETPIWCDLCLSGAGFAETLPVPMLVGDSVNEPLGPDQYGYMAFDDGDIAYAEHPTYDWVEIHGIGTKLSLTDDAIATVDLPSGFGPIYFYGRRSTQLSICSNGWVAPDTSTRVDFNNLQLPSSYAPPRIIALNWDNLDPTAYGWIDCYHDAPNHRFIVEYDSIPYFPQYVDAQKCEIIFYDTTQAGPSGDNVFVMQYKTANNIGSITAGIQNNDGTSGLTYLYNSNYPRQSAPIVPGRAIKFVALAPTAVGESRLMPDMAQSEPVSVRVSPNPVSGTGHFTYFLSRAGPLHVGLYDAAGRLVRELVNGPGSAGTHVSNFQLQNSGSVVPSGVYFCRLQTEQGDAAQKLVVR